MSKIRGGKVGISKAPPKPICRTHKVPLVFRPDKVRWECPSPDCKAVAHPKIDEDGRPVIGKGKIHLIRHQKENGHDSFYLRTDNNVMIGIDALVVNHKDGVGKTYLTLAFDSIIDLELDGS